MKTLLISDCFSYTLQLENVGIARISAYLKKNQQDVDMYYIQKTRNVDMILQTITLNYDVYAFSVYENNAELFIDLARKIKQKKPDATITFGSKFISLYYEELLSYCDFEVLCVLGDGEYTTLEIINAKAAKINLHELAARHPHIASKESMNNKRPLSIDIQKLPWPDRSFSKKTKTLATYICDCHGCVGNCSFCSQRCYYSKWNGREAEDLFGEIYSIYHSSNVRLFIFTGGSFEDPGKKGKEKIRNLCKMIIDSKMKVCFRCYLRAETFKDCSEDIELMYLMKAAGFHVVFVGIESGNNDDLILYGKRAREEDNKRVLSLLRKADIYGGGYGFIMFNPYSTTETLRNNYMFLSSEGNWDLQKYVSELKIYKNTTIYYKVKKDGLLEERKRSWNYISNYKFVDQKVEEMYFFILNEIKTSLVEKIMQDEDFTTTAVESFYSFMPDGKDIRKKLHCHLKCQSELLEKYFYHLFVERDIEYCKRSRATEKA